MDSLIATSSEIIQMWFSAMKRMKPKLMRRIIETYKQRFIDTTPFEYRIRTFMFLYIRSPKTFIDTVIISYIAHDKQLFDQPIRFKLLVPMFKTLYSYNPSKFKILSAVVFDHTFQFLKSPEYIDKALYALAEMFPLRWSSEKYISNWISIFVCAVIRNGMLDAYNRDPMEIFIQIPISPEKRELIQWVAAQLIAYYVPIAI